MEIQARLAEKLPEWEAFDIVPSERIPDGNKTTEPQRYGMPFWRDLFSPRQILCHGTSVEVFRELLDADRSAGKLTEVREAAYGYLALTLDTFLNYSNRAGRWDTTTGRARSIFDRHDFAFVWSYAEMAPLVSGVGYDWAIDKTIKCIDELVALVRPEADSNAGTLFASTGVDTRPTQSVTITCKPGDSLGPHHGRQHRHGGHGSALLRQRHVRRAVGLSSTSGSSVPPGTSFPSCSAATSPDKDNEAVANPARFRGQKGARALAGRGLSGAHGVHLRRVPPDAENRRGDDADVHPQGDRRLGCADQGADGSGLRHHRVLADQHRGRGQSCTSRDKAAANSTIFLVCRPRADDARAEQDRYWEDVEPRVARAVRERVEEFQAAGIARVDLYLASFGPALEEFSRHWPIAARHTA